MIKVEALFCEEFSGLIIIKLLYQSAQTTVIVKLKFQRNVAVLDITNVHPNTVIFTPENT